eukprot:1156832-Pelagomonas_calceolata.AAC.7
MDVTGLMVQVGRPSGSRCTHQMAIIQLKRQSRQGLHCHCLSLSCFRAHASSVQAQQAKRNPDMAHVHVVESGVDTCVSDTFGYSRTDDFFGNEYVFNLTQFSEDRVIAVETKGGASGGFDSWIFISKTCKEDQSLDDVVTYNDDKSYTNTLESRFSYAQFRAKANTDYFIVIGGYNGFKGPSLPCVKTENCSLFAACGEIDAEFSASLLSFGREETSKKWLGMLTCLSVEGAVLTTSLTMDLDFDDLDAMFEVGLAATFRQNMLKEFPSFFTNKIAECYNMVQTGTCKGLETHAQKLAI